jgi:hypothetical protein
MLQFLLGYLSHLVFNIQLGASHDESVHRRDAAVGRCVHQRRATELNIKAEAVLVTRSVACILRTENIFPTALFLFASAPALTSMVTRSQWPLYAAIPNAENLVFYCVLKENTK